MSNYFILLDIGGTFIKSARRIIGSSNVENLYINRTPEFIYSDFPNIREISADSIRARVTEHLSFQVKDSNLCQGILVAGQMGGYQICPSNFSPVQSFVSWQDSRGIIQIPNAPTNQNGYQLAYKEWSKTERFKTGYEIRENTPYVGLTTDLISTPNRQENMAFVSLLLGVSRNLVTDFSASMHITDAASTGMVDIIEGKWMLDKLLHTNFQVTFPKITSSLIPIGINPETKAKVYTPVGDQQASLLGMELSAEKIIFNIGTGGQVSKIVNSLDANSNTQHRPYFGSKYIQTVTHLPSGRLLNDFISFIFNGDLSPTNFLKFNDWGGSSGEFVNFETQEANLLFSQFQKESLSEKQAKLIARSFFEHLAIHYADAYHRIDPNGLLQPVIGGGMGQKMSSLVFAIERKIDKKFVVSESVETTLDGLGQLAESII